MKLFLIFTAIFTVFSCSEKPEFTQLKKDWNNLVKENFKEDSQDSTEIKISNVLDSAHSNQSEIAINSKENKISKSRKEILEFSKKYLGTPYKYASSNPEEGFDCSGFLYFVFNNFGYKVPRSSREYEFFGKEIPLSNAKRGDLVLFKPTENDTSGDRIGHIGILINENGNNADFIHASSGKAGAVTISSLASKHYKERYVKTITILEK